MFLKSCVVAFGGFSLGIGVSSVVASRLESASLPVERTWGVPWVEDWDQPVERKLPIQPRSIARHLILLRHGQYGNEKSSKEDQDHNLTVMGKNQAERTGQFLQAAIGHSECFPCKNVTSVVSSDLNRAQQTAKIILNELQVNTSLVCDPKLREVFPCDPEPPFGKKKATHEAKQRIELAFEQYFHRPTSDSSSTEIIVCHANVIRYFVCRALQLPPEAWLRFSIAHCGITSIAIDGRGRVKVTSVGSAGHLPPNLQTIHNLA
jgi:serine/threonine-protein phosphatase PGAM5